MVSFKGVPDECKIILIEFSIKIQNWLCSGRYEPPSPNDKYFLDNLSFILSKLTCQLNNIMLMEDFNLTVENANLEDFMNTCDMECFIINPTCF